MSGTTQQRLPTFARPPVFLSASVPLIDRHPKYFGSADAIAIRDAIVALASVVLPVTGLVFGGHPAITPLISAVASELPSVAGQVVLYQSQWFVPVMPSHPAIQHIQLVPPQPTRDASLREMRNAMLNSYKHFTAGVFIGGMDGVEQEFDQFRPLHPEAMLLPVATAGAAAAIVLDSRPPPTQGWPIELRNDLAYLSMFHKLLQM
jgi:SLOG cluster3 family